MDNYTKQAEQFLADTGTTLVVEYLYTGLHFDDDAENRDIYQLTLKNEHGVYSTKFGDSIHNTQRRAFTINNRNLSDPEARKLGFKTRADIIAARNAKPSAYDVLASVTKSDPGTFANFCSDYGYDSDSIRAQKMYFSVQEEFAGIQRLFTAKQLEQLQEIN